MPSVLVQQEFNYFNHLIESFNPLELNEVKIDVLKLKEYYMNIMKVLFNIKKMTAFDEHFWERDIHYIIKNNSIHIYLNDMKDFLFKL